MSSSKVSECLQVLGALIKRTRAKRMDQEEFALRVGCSSKTVSRMELGQPVNSETLLQALELLGLIDDFIITAEQQLKLAATNPSRHRAGADPDKDFPNDF
ncbi:XRE family transcriptional regulator [Aliidiomarina iranensis]|uniref:XRE family transcriptional regulator n=1 Tax=Aliidiomarina iranensis TaxID=1434071 RepID=A0A432VT61_9GAMM|nr:helix-turn-helix transcriptional regulator [Aliidiomarina iranensis]RUO19641.1 XRE family transcriptional regulator [Aliidiomarina iranensis]